MHWNWLYLFPAALLVLGIALVWNEISWRKKDPGYDKRMSDLDAELRKKEGRDP